MRILILSCNTGEGHNATARAIRLAAEAKGDTVEIWDALSFWPAGTNQFVCGGHVFLYKNAPELFGAGYRFFELVSEIQNERREAGKGKNAGKAISYLVKHPSEKLYEDICQGNFDAIISVHVFASLMLTEIRRQWGEGHPTYFVATDYTCSPGVHLSDFDACFIPDEGLIEEFVSQGIPQEKLLPYGIPVREEFYRAIPQAEAKAVLHLPFDKRIVLMMSGSMGCGPIAETVESILTTLPSDAVLVPVCGRNETLYTQLTALPQTGDSLFPIGFTDAIATYMDAADLIVTKAGGLSSTEAAVKHLPILFIDAIPGLESHNRDYFAKAGFARFGKSSKEIAEQIAFLLAHPPLLAAMREKLTAHFTHHAANEIVDYVHRDVTLSQNIPPEEYANL